MTSMGSISPARSATSTSNGRKRSLPPTVDDRRDRRTRDDGSRARRDESPPWWESDRRSASGRGGVMRSDRRSGDYDNRRDYRSRDGRYEDRSSRGRDHDYRSSSNRSSNGFHGDRRRDDYDRHGKGGYHDNRTSRSDDRDETDVLNYSDEPSTSSSKVVTSSSRSAHQARVTAPSVISSTFPLKDEMSTDSKSDPQASTFSVSVQSHAESEAELDLEVKAPVDPEAIIAERRRRRAEILAKYSNANNSTATSEVSTPTAERAATPEVNAAEEGEVEERDSKPAKLGTASPSAPLIGDSTPKSEHEQGDFNLFKDADEDAAIRAGEQDASTHIEGEEEVSAADYNPDEDRKRDDRRRAERGAKREDPGKYNAVAVDLTVDHRDAEQGGDDDEDDMFAIGTKTPKASELGDDGNEKPAYIPIIHREFNEAAGDLADNFDDSDGYYKLILGELLDNGRYHVHANLGRGMFSSVVRAKDTESPSGEDVAIKIVRSQESMFKAGLKEAQILRKLQEADPDDKRHLVRLFRTFEHRGHLCLVFENLSMNLREVVKRFGKDVGINLRAVRAYASQMFLALALLKKCDIMHADIKPDNILVNESKSALKVCDLGSASDVSENDITPYLVSRFYRAPEIILGLPYDCSLDTWSIACTLYELYTGKILFPGRTNNHMLLLIMELKGKFPHKLLKKGRFTDQHFDPSLNFISVERNESLKTIALSSKPAHDLRSRLMPASVTKKLKEDEARLLGHFVDLLDKMLSLEPSKRPLPKDLLSHPFIRG